MFSKKGQEGITIGTLLLIILGIIVVVVIIIGATGGLNFVFEKIKIAPGQSLEAKTQSCIIAAKSNLRADYCGEFAEVKIAGQTQHVNCEFEQVEKNVQAEAVPLDCKDARMTPEQYCAQLIRAKKADETTLVNGVRCAARVSCTGAELNGAFAIKEDGRESCASGDKKVKVLKGYKEAGQQACCIE